MISEGTKIKWQTMIEDLQEADSKLNRWETEFVDSVSMRIADLTWKQSKKLHELWEKHCG